MLCKSYSRDPVELRALLSFKLRLLLFLFHGDVLEAEHTLLCLDVIPAQLLPFPPLLVGSIHEQTSTRTEKLSQGLCSKQIQRKLVLFRVTKIQGNSGSLNCWLEAG